MKEKNNIYRYILAFVTAVMLVMIIVAASTSCNKQIETITVDVKSWTDFEDGDQIQIKAKDGTTYLVHSSNVTLIHDES